MIIDTHCHIYESEMDNAEDIIKEAGKNDISLILNGTDPVSNGEVLELSHKYDNAYATLGYFIPLPRMFVMRTFRFWTNCWMTIRLLQWAKSALTIIIEKTIRICKRNSLKRCLILPKNTTCPSLCIQESPCRTRLTF